MGIIFFLSHQPGDLNYLPPLIGLDKLLHVVAYGILAASFLFALQPIIHEDNRSRIGVMVVLFCILFGLSDEYHQSYIAGRFASIWDLLADSVGALLVVAFRFRK